MRHRKRICYEEWTHLSFIYSNVLHLQSSKSRLILLLCQVNKLQIWRRNINRNFDFLLIFSSDHGMATITPRNFIDLIVYIDKTQCSMYGTSPVLQVNCKTPELTAQACANLTKMAKVMKNFNAYTNSELPPNWRVNNEQRFGPCTVVAELGWGFQDMYDYIKWFNEKFDIKRKKDVRLLKVKKIISYYYIIIFVILFQFRWIQNMAFMAMIMG